ncbi:hypothetical protein [Xanthomonas cassavae]|uniref:hypothetical protein n=1 Tax=Xanthomonas cassavae TaxID=56450 RepID=UPI002B1CD9C6|nr:hypothetical protein [Xanthomonas cassavae]
MQWIDEDMDRNCVVFDAATLPRIAKRAVALHSHHQAQAYRGPGAVVMQATPPEGLQRAWEQLQIGRCTASAAFDLLRTYPQAAPAVHAEQAAQLQPSDPSPQAAPQQSKTCDRAEGELTTGRKRPCRHWQA